MKIGIVTLYSSINYGAYFQAYALQVILNDLGYDVEFFDTNKEINFLKLDNIIGEKRRLSMEYLTNALGPGQ